MELIVIGEEVARHLGPERTELVRQGSASPPIYECLVCRTTGDMRVTAAAAVLFTGPSGMVLSWVHARCGLSVVHPVDRMEDIYGRHGTVADAGPMDMTWATITRLAGGLYPSLAIMPGHGPRAVVPVAGTNEHAVFDVVLDELRLCGFDKVDLSGQTNPTRIPHWGVRVDAGRLIAITRPGGKWWATDTSMPMPAGWRTEARRTREVFLMVIAPGSLPDRQEVDTATAVEALRAAASNNQLVGAILPLRGTLS